MSRTVGPFVDVTTARVEGAYEICEGLDGTGRSVQILTLGITSAKDPGRRALLSDTVAWAHATAGPNDAPILQADLTGEQPFVVTLRNPQQRGAERILDRLLELGPTTGPIPLIRNAQSSGASAPGSDYGSAQAGSANGPAPGHYNNAMTSGATERKRKAKKPPRVNVLVAILGVLALMVLAGGGWAGWTYFDAERDNNSAAEEADSDNADDNGNPLEDGFEPQFKADAEPFNLPSETFSDNDDATTVAETGWPFAYRVPTDFNCEIDEEEAQCEAANSSQVQVNWDVCSDGCHENEQESRVSDLPFGPLDRYSNGVAFSERHPFDGYRASLSVFVPVEDETVHVTVVVDVEGDDTVMDAQKVINDVLTQAQAI